MLVTHQQTARVKFTTKEWGGVWRGPSDLTETYPTRGQGCFELTDQFFTFAQWGTNFSSLAHQMTGPPHVFLIDIGQTYKT